MNENFPESCYRTGSTNPPKSRRGLLAFLLVAVILLCGIVTVLSFLNVRLWHINQNSAGENSFRFSLISPTTSEDTPADDPAPAHENTEITLQLNQSPQSVENVPQEAGLSLQDIYSRAIDSVVSISCDGADGSFTGSGVVVSENGYIVTNAHVVDIARSVTVLLSDGTSHAARVVGSDALSDLAVLCISATGLTPAEFGDDRSLRVGDAVVAIGDPLGIQLRGTMTNGIVSAINRDIRSEGRTMTLIQTNAALNHGNSGGPLLNCYGQVIGINTLKIGDALSSTNVEGLGFAIPSTTVKDVVDQLLKQGYVSGRPGLGITVQQLSTLDRLYYNIPQGLYITEVQPGSSAAEAGIQPGDVLLSIDDTATATAEGLQQLLYSHKAGDVVTVHIYRGGTRYKAVLTLDEAHG